MDEIDTWRAAAEMMRQHEEDAALEAALKADAHLEKGDMEGFRAWKRIVDAINTLERSEPPAGYRVQ